MAGSTQSSGRTFSVSEWRYYKGRYILLSNSSFALYFDSETYRFLGAEQATTGEWIEYGEEELDYFRKYNEDVYIQAVKELHLYLEGKGLE